MQGRREGGLPSGVTCRVGAAARLTAWPWHCPGHSPERADLELQGKASLTLPLPFPGVLGSDSPVSRGAQAGLPSPGPPSSQPPGLRVQAPTGCPLISVCTRSPVANSLRAKVVSNVSSWFRLPYYSHLQTRMCFICYM